MRFKLLSFTLAFILQPAHAFNKTPDIRLKTGYIATTFSSGDSYTDESLGTLMAIQPSVTWALPNFRSRLGIHMHFEFGSEFGLTPISGIGLNAYIYPWGISSSHEKLENDTIIQKSKSGPFVMAAFTPINFNINDLDGNNNRTFSSFIYDSMFGAGYDYAFRQNLILSAELVYRFGSAVNDNQGLNGVNYSGYGLMLSILTSYY